MKLSPSVPLRVTPVIVTWFVIQPITPAMARSVSPAQIVISPKDVPGLYQIKKNTYALGPTGPCLSGYQSSYGFQGFRAPAGPVGVSAQAYVCPSSAVAVTSFPTWSGLYAATYTNSRWHYQVLPQLAAGHLHLAWLLRGWAGPSTETLNLAFQRNAVLAFLQVTFFTPVTLASVEQATHRLAHIMNRRIVLASR